MSAWTINGRTKGDLPQVGRTYKVKHSRKGEFVIHITAVNGEWASGLIVDGTARAMLADNVRVEGEEVNLRDSLCQLTDHGVTKGQKIKGLVLSG